MCVRMCVSVFVCATSLKYTNPTVFTAFSLCAAHPQHFGTADTVAEKRYRMERSPEHTSSSTKSFLAPLCNKQNSQARDGGRKQWLNKCI